MLPSPRLPAQGEQTLVAGIHGDPHDAVADSAMPVSRSSKRGIDAVPHGAGPCGQAMVGAMVQHRSLLVVLKTYVTYGITN